MVRSFADRTFHLSAGLAAGAPGAPGRPLAVPELLAGLRRAGADPRA